MSRWIDRLGDALSWVAGGLYFATGLMVVWEVVARYVFTAPTIWAEEMSRVFLLWGTFLPMAALLHRRAHIRITLLLGLIGPAGRKAAEIASLLFVAGFSVFVAWYGWDIARDSLRVGRTTGTMLNIPQWWTEIVIPIAFVLLAIQCVVEAVRLLAGAEVPSPHFGKSSE